MTPVRLGTRGSALALAQSGLVADALARELGARVELVPIRTDGDDLAGPLADIGSTGVFATRLRVALTEGVCDLVVHSFKDLPVVEYPGLRVAAVPPREDPRDALCARGGARLADLPRGARVGTGSPRRAAGLHRARPDLEVVPIRGNVDTRLAAVGDDLDAVVLAAAGLARLGRLDAVSEFFDPGVLMPAPAQGALAIEVRAEGDGSALLAALDALDDPASRAEAIAERAVLAELEAGCSAPISASAALRDGRLALRARVVAPDGAAAAEVELAVAFDARRGDDAADAAGRAAAAAALGRDAGRELRGRMDADGALRDLLDRAAGA